MWIFALEGRVLFAHPSRMAQRRHIYSFLLALLVPCKLVYLIQLMRTRRLLAVANRALSIQELKRCLGLPVLLLIIIFLQKIFK